MKLHIRDTNPVLIGQLRDAFRDVRDEVSIYSGSIFGSTDSTDPRASPPSAADALVSPANSFGFMDGGIDQVYIDRFGPELQRRVQDAIILQPSGELLVGDALFVAMPENSEGIEHLVVAPTMRVPMLIGPLNAYLATRAAVRLALSRGVNLLLMPGMGTGCGGLDPGSAAVAMRKGYDHALQPRPFPKTLREAGQWR